MLEIENLCVSYGDHLALSGVSLRLEAGEVLAVIGPNGAGKSTLVRALSGVLPVHNGHVRFDGRDLLAQSSQERARVMAVVPQAHQLPPAFTAWDTVLLGRTPYLNWFGQLSPRDEDLARRAMQRTSTLHLAHRRVGELSGGEQQRLLLARALTQAAPVLLMDEPTAHLDLQYQVHILDQVRRLARQEGLSVLVVLHDLNLVARYAGRVALLVDGCLAKCGPVDEVLTESVLSPAYGIPLQVIHSGQHPTPIILPAP
ncbi:MAG: ABC transporter ATP-binding protein [Anaerolineaceae bacterium]|nr:ABC transporter ATP-binding protein [Anaerolineaceae bacterium]